MKTLYRTLIATVAAAVLVLSPAANAHEKGDWLLRIGAGLVDPDSDNGEVVSVDSGASIVFTGAYFFTPNIALELLAATPFSHDIELKADGSKVGEVKHLPPTLSLQYHFPTAGKFKPYVGAGLNYTIIFDEDTTGALAGTDLDVDDSFGFAAQLGTDIVISDTMFLNFDVRWADIDADVEISPVGLAFDVEIDPMVYSLALGWKF